MVKNILILNIGIHLVASLVSLPINDYLGLNTVFSDDFAPYQFVTYMWLHSHQGYFHLLGNMIMVFFIGPLLENIWGSKRFLIFYLTCGIGAGILYAGVDAIERLPLKQDAENYIENPSPEAFEKFIIDNKKMGLNVSYLGEVSDAYFENPSYKEQTVAIVRDIYDQLLNIGNMVGASGAIYGLLFAMAFLFPNTEFYIYFLFPVKAKYLAFGLAMFSIYSEFNRSPGDNVAHLAHLSGMLIAFLLLKFWNKNPKNFY